ncbi:programmed cell death protein 1 isoform X3 [Elephas maximus indicus]|uniref:programmed cell death protein 1 isoform X3 n=1 Tax=Elephas maximus indicus TaxID=99487 RepID=UPI00211662EE|nr:programmed cell death protein 1 isoform X3 [Elephas maximus indicus]
MRVVWTPWQLIWMVLQLGWRLGQLQVCPERPGSPLTFLPAQLTVPEGGEATFFCSYPNMTAPTMLNWYRSSPSNQSVKLAAFPKDHGEPARDQRFSITQLAGKQAFRLHISTVLRNDSNTYYCGAINLPPETQITESPCAELTVTDRVSESPTTHPSPAPGPKGQFQALVISITSVLVGVLVLLLLAWVLATVLPRGTQEGGPFGHTCVHCGLRRAGLPATGEDPRAPRCLLTRADRVRHHCFPRWRVPHGPQGLSRWPVGTPASETGGHSLLLAPLTTGLSPPWP